MASLTRRQFDTTKARYRATVTKNGRTQYRKNGKFVSSRSFMSAQRFALDGSLQSSLTPSEFDTDLIFQFSNLLDDDGRALELLAEIDPRIIEGQDISADYRQALGEIINRRRTIQILEDRLDPDGTFDDERRQALEDEYLRIDFDSTLTDEEKSALFKILFGSL